MRSVLAVLLMASSCGTTLDPRVAAAVEAPLLVDGSTSGAGGLFFLAPLGGRSARHGENWEASSPEVQLDEIDPATGAVLTAGPRFTLPARTLKLKAEGDDAEEEEHEEEGSADAECGEGSFFEATWRPPRSSTAGSVHRARVLLEGQELGFADVVLVGPGRPPAAVPGTLRVKIGRALKIRFLISQPAVDIDLDGIVDWRDNCPHDANAAQLDSVGNGVGDACRCRAVSCAATDACHEPGACVPTTGACTTPARPDGVACPDGHCAGGACVADRCTTFAFGSSDVVTSGQPWLLESVDFDGDGDLDLVSGEYFGGLSSFRNDGAGGFTRVANTPSPLVYSLEVVDMDRDGLQDVVIGNYVFSTVSIHRGLGGGVFGVARTLPVAELWAAWPVDVDVDGRTDLVVGRVSGLLDVYPQLQSGEFGPPTTWDVRDGSSRPLDLAAGDLNGDGLPDLVIANASRTMTVLLGSGGAAFKAPVHFRGGNHPARVALGHVNGDGALDAIVLNTVTNDVSVWYGVGDGTFTPAATLSVLPLLSTESPGDLALADLDGDGRLDIVLVSWRAQAAVAFMAESGGWSAPVTLATDQQPTSLATGDFDRDGKQDLALTDQSLQHVRVLLNRCK